MAIKQIFNAGTAPDGSQYVVLTDGAGNLAPAAAADSLVQIDQTTPGTTNGVVVNSSALPTGAATSANQTTMNTNIVQLHTDLTAATPAGTNTIGAVTLNTIATTGGIATTARLAAAAATTNATNVKTSSGRIYSIQGYNAAAYPVYLVLYDSAANPPVPGSTTIRKKVAVPATTAFALDWALGLSFNTGIGYALTKLAADADTTALAANDVLQLNVDYV